MVYCSRDETAMTAPDKPARCLIPADEIEAGRETFNHPWNPNSEVVGTHLSALTGLVETGVSRVTIPPGKESFVYHRHQTEEEWIYVLSGRGVAEINGEAFEVGPGDFMGFPAGRVAHHLKNPFPEPLEYLMGGSHRPLEVAEFPRLGKVMIRREGAVTIFDEADGRPFGPLD